MKNLKRILIFRYALIITAALIAVSLLVIIPIRSYTISREQNNLEEQAQLFARDFQRFFSVEITPDEIDAYLEELAGDLPIRLTVIDTEGSVLGDSNFPAEEMENHAGRPEVAAALEGRVASARRDSRTLGRGFIYAAAPITIDGEVAGVARVALEEADVMPLVFQVWWIILIAFGVLLVVIITVSIWTERTVIAGLNDMREAAAGLAGGDLDRRVAQPDIEEFSELAREFNTMAEQVRSRVEEAAEESGKLETVLDNISAGVMVTDSESRIVMLNAAADGIMNVEGEKAVGRRIIEVFSNRELDLAVSRAAAGESIDEEIELVYPQRMFLLLKSNPVRGTDGQVVATVSAIEDITALKRLNQVRQDFVANVSHELRTPVATIRALTDSLLDGAVDEKERAERFLKDLDREATRLSQLIEDLLTLSRLEAKETGLQLEEFHLAELVQECLQSKRTLAEEYGVRLDVEPSEQELAIRGDRQLLGTALNNLIDNAIKYNRAGGRVTVAMQADKSGGGVTVKVEDDGIGIPREELPRVFERFYRIDKARSRDTGGTGLGLSIVKHIAELHGGAVTVSSVMGEGSEFTIVIPEN
ncbi:MAG: HAMP domain-containing histidine kinase [Actinobacteria bacterium]|jgi:two-component system phosphate regulon sensor histidine kinase PhoR|nr:MAG: HAMP domain-containing histidine kinase [Actinomycetota bacterium]